MSMDYVYLNTDEVSSVDEYVEALDGLVPGPANAAMLAAVRESFEEDEDEVIMSEVLDAVVEALNDAGTETMVIDRELDTGYILVVQL